MSDQVFNAINEVPKAFEKVTRVLVMRWTGTPQSAYLIEEWCNTALYTPHQDAYDDGSVGCNTIPATLNIGGQAMKAGDMVLKDKAGKFFIRKSSELWKDWNPVL